jgi:hypothetical protein
MDGGTMKRSIIGALGALVGLTLAGCATTLPPTTIAVSDSGVFQPSVRVGWSISKVPGAPSDPQSSHGIEIGAMRASGDDTQSLAAGQGPVRIGGTTFNPGQTLRYEADLTYYDVTYRFRRFFGDGSFGIEALAGLAHAILDLTVSSATQRASESRSSTGIQGGVGGIWRLRPGTSLQARYTWFGSGDYDDSTTASSVEFSAAQALGRNIVVRGGYAVTKAKSERDYSLSRIEVELSGPLLRLELQF